MTSKPKLAGLAVFCVTGIGLTGCSASPRSGTPAGSRPTAQLAAAQSPSPTAATVTAAGTGVVTGQPDTLTVGVGVSTTAPHAASALSQNNALAAAVQAALQKDGVQPSDIQTTGLSLQQQWNGGSPSGYAAYDQVTATIHKLQTAGSVIDDALAAAGDAGRLNEVSLSFSNSSPLLAAARRQAVLSAQAQAAQMAEAAGGHLGALESLNEPATQASGYPLMFAGAATSAPGAAAPAVPIQPGTQQMSVQVTGVWQVVAGP